MSDLSGQFVVCTTGEALLIRDGQPGRYAHESEGCPGGDWVTLDLHGYMRRLNDRVRAMERALTAPPRIDT